MVHVLSFALYYGEIYTKYFFKATQQGKQLQ